jgi:hypothetical protein
MGKQVERRLGSAMVARSTQRGPSFHYCLLSGVIGIISAMRCLFLYPGAILNCGTG